MTAPGRGVYTYMYQPGGTLRLESIKEGATVRYGYFYAGAAGDRGNMTTRTAPTTSQAFTFDRAQRIVALAGGATQTYTYDGLGRRATIDELDTGAHSDHVYNQAGQFLYDHRSNDYNLKSGSAWTKYFYLDRHLIATATSIGGPGPGGIATYQHTDGLGSPVITTGDKGVVFGYTLHEPYGRSTEPLHTFQYEPGYAGHVVDPSTGLSYMQQRYYDPAAGRFLSVDPVAASAGSFNRYWYANNNPYNFVDPDGRAACSKTTGSNICYQSPKTETGNTVQPGPNSSALAKDGQVKIAMSSGKTSDGTVLNINEPTSTEQGIRVSSNGTSSNHLEKLCWFCSDGTSGSGGTYNVSALAGDDSPAHTHPGLINGLPGRGDAGLAGKTGQGNYVMSRLGAFAVEKTAVGYRVRQIYGERLNRTDRAQLIKQIGEWNTSGGASNSGGVSCRSDGC